MLPVELLNEIVFWYFESCMPGGPTILYPKENKSSKPEWHTVQPLTLASKATRSLTLGAWFQTIVMRDEAHLLEVPPIPEVVFWARTVHWLDVPGTEWSTRPPDHDEWRRGIGAFARVRKLRYDNNGDDPFSPAFRVLGRWLVSLTELELRKHGWPSPGLIIPPIVDTLPNLRVLELHQVWGWCSLCNLCDVLDVSEAPPPSIVYTNGDGLPKLYNRFLASLPHLRTVRLTVAYRLRMNGFISLQELKTPWRGECGDCITHFLTDEGFAADWEVKNKAEPHPPSLREVVWTFAPEGNRIHIGIQSGTEEGVSDEGDVDNAADDDVE